MSKFATLPCRIKTQGAHPVVGVNAVGLGVNGYTVFKKSVVVFFAEGCFGFPNVGAGLGINGM